MKVKNAFLISLIISTALSVSCNDDDTEISGCANPAACNFNSKATKDDGSCDFECFGCLNRSACNYDPDASVDDGSCDFTSCTGCTNSDACNYDPSASIDDGTCEFASCTGCTNSDACNYDPNATLDDGACEFTSCYGCTDPEAFNYDPNATQEDNSGFPECQYCGSSLTIARILLTSIPANNVDTYVEVLVNDELAIRTVEKTYNGSSLDFTGEYTFNEAGSLELINLTGEESETLTVSLYVDDVEVSSKSYLACSIQTKISIQGNIFYNNYGAEGLNCNNTCIYNAVINFNEKIRL